MTDRLTGRMRRLRRMLPAVAGLAGLAGTVSLAAAPAVRTEELADLLHNVGGRVQQFFARAHSLICLETVHTQPLGTGLSPTGMGRNVESELRLSWDPATTDGAPEARMLRRVLKVNGGPPRRRDPDNCTAAEQFEIEEPPLAMLLPEQQAEYSFSLAGSGRVDRRAAIMIDYRERAPATVDIQPVQGNEDCVNFEMNGGLRGRIWIDQETGEVLRLDQGLIGLVEI